MNKEKLKGLLEVSCCTYHDGLCAEIYDYVINLQQENQQLKKQKDDAVKYIKSKKAIINTDYIRIFDLFEIDEQGYTEELLRMLGEIDDR